MYASAGLSGVRHLVVRGATRSDRGLVTRGRDRAAAAARSRSCGSNEEELVVARVDVIMPQMGESIAEGTVSRWLKKVGDEVKRDEPIFEISTDKVDAEIPAPSAGVLAEILVTEGQTVPVQTVVARLETEKGTAVAGSNAPAPAVAAAGDGNSGTKAPAAAGGPPPKTQTTRAAS